MNFENRRLEYKKQLNLQNNNVSFIWKKLRKDFQKKKSHLRGYGLSTHKQYKINLYILFSKYLNLPFKIIIYIMETLKKNIQRVLSWFIFNFDFNAAERFGFGNYPGDIFGKAFLDSFLNKYSKYNISYSYNTLKAFYYLSKLNEYVKIKNDIKILEIGAGVFNFGHLLSYELDKFEYVICDLPEMILNAHQQITDIYLPICKGNYDVYLPNEIDNFQNSDSDRKILFITSEQLRNGILSDEKKFDMFINHESFAEMDINVVNDYLKKIKTLMKKGAIVNLVNRHTRPQANLYDEFKKVEINNITCFDDYELNFCDFILKEIDKFRASIPIAQKTPNIFYIGKVNQ